MSVQQSIKSRIPRLTHTKPETSINLLSSFLYVPQVFFNNKERIHTHPYIHTYIIFTHMHTYIPIIITDKIEKRRQQKVREYTYKGLQVGKGGEEMYLYLN